MLQFQRQQTSPVITKGATYGGIQADALANPSVCWDGTRWVLTVSIWNIANSKWYSIFFTSPDFLTWTYVSGSLLSPGGSDYIFGNGGLAWFGGKYWLSVSHYPSGSGLAVAAAAMYTSTDRVNWTLSNDTFLQKGAGGTWDSTSVNDTSLSVNPINARLECWYMGWNGTAATIGMTDSPDGITWTKRGQYLSASKFGDGNNFGEPSVWYWGGVRYMVAAQNQADQVRYVGMWKSVTLDTTWATFGSCLAAYYANTDENVNVIDPTVVGVYDIGDGRGLKARMIYAGSDNNSGTDATNSNLRAAWLDMPALPVVATTNHAGSNSLLPFASGGRVINTLIPV